MYQLQVTWGEMAFVILFLLGAVALIYLIKLFRNLNGILRVVNSVLKENKDNLDKTLKDVPIISANMAEVSEVTKNEIKILEKVIIDIGDTSDLAKETVHMFKNDIVGKAKSIIDIIELIRKWFVKLISEREKATEDSTQNKSA